MTINRGIITCALRFSVFFTTPLFSDPTWYASGGPMIYALVEPSIYMIASILPTTRHLHERLRRTARRTAHLRHVKSGGLSQNSGGVSQQSTELERVENGGTNGQGITRQVDIWQAQNHSSQEELTLGGCYQSQQEWHPSRAADASLASTPEPHSPAKSRVAKN